MDNDTIKEIRKRLLDIEKAKEIREAEDDLSTRGLESSGRNEIGLIEAKYSELKKLVEEGVEISALIKKVNVQEFTTPKVEIAKVISSCPEEIKWPEEFRWDSERRNYLLGGGKFIPFTGERNIRRDVFKQIVDQQGQWKLVSEIAEALTQKESKVRVIVNQISNRLLTKFKKYIRLEPRNKRGLAGAYKAVSFP